MRFAPQRGATSKPGVAQRTPGQDGERRLHVHRLQNAKCKLQNAKYVSHRNAVQPQSLGSRSAPQDWTASGGSTFIDCKLQIANCKIRFAPQRGATSKPGVAQRTPGQDGERRLHVDRLQIANWQSACEVQDAAKGGRWWNSGPLHGDPKRSGNLHFALCICICILHFAFCILHFAFCNLQWAQPHDPATQGQSADLIARASSRANRSGSDVLSFHHAATPGRHLGCVFTTHAPLLHWR